VTTPSATLRLVQGGLSRRIFFGALQIVVAPSRLRPFEIDAIVCEEDTWLIMSAEPKEIGAPEHPIRLMTALMTAKPEPVGSVLVKGGTPLKFLAVVHDVDQDPTWNEDWIAEALINVFQEAERRKLRAIGLPLLGTRHGKLPVERFPELLRRVLDQHTLIHLKRLWLTTSGKNTKRMMTVLRSVFPPV
jgi:hypothetical protein